MKINYQILTATIAAAALLIIYASSPLLESALAQLQPAELQSLPCVTGTDENNDKFCEKRVQKNNPEHKKCYMYIGG